MQFTRFPINDDGNTIQPEGGNFMAIRNPNGFDIMYTGYTHTGQLFGRVTGRKFVANPECNIAIDVAEMVDLTCLLLTCAFENKQTEKQSQPNDENPVRS